MKPYRSFLFVPGNRPRMLAKAPTTGADALILDLEDSVPEDAKPEARAMVAELLPAIGAPAAFVRINSPSSGHAKADLDAIVGSGLSGVFVPKVESVAEVRQLDGWIGELEGRRELSGPIAMICMIETAASLRQAYEIATAAERVASLCCSSAEAGDLQTDLGCGWSLEGTAMLYARSKIVADSRAAGIEHPIDGVYARIRDIDGLARDTELSQHLGYKGRAVIHPDHISTVNRIYSPTAETIAYCRGLVKAMEVALAEGRAAAAYEGKMIDYAMEKWARRILAQAEQLRDENQPR